MVNAQEWLDKNYPKDGVCQLKKYKNRWEKEYNNENYGKPRKEITNLDISNQSLQGSLKLEGFTNLQKFDCSNNQLKILNLTNCQQLEEIECGFNSIRSLILPINNQIKSLWCPCNQLTNIPVNLNPLSLSVLGLRDNCLCSNLNIFSQLVNLEKLYIGQNQFTGSLSALVNLTKLKELHVWGTQVDSGLEYLPECLERFYCGETKLFKDLVPYMKPEYGAPEYGIPGKDGYYNLSEWRKNNQKATNKTYEMIAINWQENIYPFKNFTEKVTQEWTSREFNKSQGRKWLESGLQPTDAGFAQWLRDELKISPEQLLDDYDDEELREQYDNYLNLESGNYSNSWRSIHPNFTSELRHEWEKNRFDYQQTKEWIENGLQPTDAYYARWLKNCDKTPEWFLEHGIEDMISYSMLSHKGEFRRNKEIRANAQEWLDKWYPKEGSCKIKEKRSSLSGKAEPYENYGKKRRNITELNINGKGLVGSLIIKDWPVLEIIYNEENHITDLILVDLPQLKEICLTWVPLVTLSIRNCPLITGIHLGSNDLTNLDWLSDLVPENLIRLNVSDNKFPAQDLSVFSRFTNLKELYINSNNFTGSLETLKNLTKLEKLNISYTKVNSGLEHLSDSLKVFICADTRLKEILRPYQGDLEKWRKDNQEMLSGSSNSHEENFNEILTKKFEKLNVDEEADEGASIYSFKVSGNLQDRQLDTLARLLTGGETCVAVCYHQEKLLIASNKEKSRYAEEYLESLQRFANEQSQENCKRLLELVVKQISTWKWGSTQKIKDKLSKIKKNKPKTFRKLIKEYQENPNKIVNFNELQQAAQKAFDKIIELKEKGNKTKANQKWGYLTIWQDTGEIIEAIIRENLDKRILEKVKNLNLENDIDYIDFEDEEQNKLHAEMKIIDKLHGEEREKDIHYIGLTKLSCPNCQAVISTLNSEGYNWKTYADESHGKEYDGWTTPKIMKGREKEIRNWKKANKSQKVKKETTSEIPNKLVDVIRLLNELKVQEQSSTQSHIQIPPK